MLLNDKDSHSRAREQGLAILSTRNCCLCLCQYLPPQVSLSTETSLALPSSISLRKMLTRARSCIALQLQHPTSRRSQPSHLLVIGSSLSQGTQVSLSPHGWFSISSPKPTYSLLRLTQNNLGLLNLHVTWAQNCLLFLP